MGVPKLVNGIIRPYFEGVARQALKQKRGGGEVPIDILSIDTNGLMYRAANEVLDLEERNPGRQKYLKTLDPNNEEQILTLENEIITMVIRLITQLITIIRPQRTLHVAIDGLVPMGKIESQRTRRLLGVMHRREALRTGTMKVGEKLFDTTSFSPGTQFMFRLNTRLEELFQTRRGKGIGPVPWPLHILYWNHLTRGEGEHKLMAALREEEPSEVVIIGKDADLVFLSLLSKHRVQIIREELNDVLDIEAIRETLEFRRIRVREFCFLLMLIGNDFLPTQPGFNEVELSYPVMEKLLVDARFIDDQDQILWEPLRKILEVLAPLQREWVEKIALSTRAYPFDLAKNDLVPNPTDPSLPLYLDPTAFRAWWVARSFQMPPFGPLKYVEQEFRADHLNYLTSIEWVFRYYNLGQDAVDWAFVYRRHFAPLLVDLLMVPEWPTLPLPHPYPMTPLGHLLAMMPKGVEQLVPRPLLGFFEEDSPMRDLHPKEIYVWHDGNNKEHFGVPYLPKLDPTRMIDLQNRIVATEAERLTFSPRPALRWLVPPSTAAPLPLPALPQIVPLAIPLPSVEVNSTKDYRSIDNQRRIAQLYGAKISEMLGMAVYPDRLPLIDMLEKISIVPIQKQDIKW
jgi:hypothetical protein